VTDGPPPNGLGKTARRLRTDSRAHKTLDCQCRWPDDVGLIVMFRSGYGASKHERPVTAAASPPRQVAVRGADRSILLWWSFLFVVSAGNLILWLLIAREMNGLSGYVAQQLWLSGIFAAACAFRSALPRVDLERQCLWNSPLSSIFVGRSVATVAELCFAAQCALLLSKLSAVTGHGSLQTVGWSILPLILVAQLCCWYAVVSLNHLGHAFEEILWSVMVLLIALCLALTWGHLPADIRLLSGIGIVACACAGVLMLGVDVPMYIARWRAGRRDGVRYLAVMEGLKDALQRRRVAHRWSEWRAEVLWMTLYFSAGVWISFCLVFV
jgi:hypothetical protein